MTVHQMRDAILKVYDTASWKKKVENMYDDQVIAIYYNFEARGILDKVMKKERPAVKKSAWAFDDYVPQETEQMTIFDLMN